MVNIRQTLNIKDKGSSIKYDINFMTVYIYVHVYTHTIPVEGICHVPCPVLSSSRVLAHVVL